MIMDNYHDDSPRLNTEVRQHTAHLLLVQDDPILERVHTRALTLSGYLVTTFCSPLSAIEAIRDLDPPPDLLIVDLYSPQLNALDIAHILAAMPHPPALLITSHDDVSNDLPPNLRVHTLIKPYSIETLRAAVERSLIH
jgi:DNA-binding NtrC family response regulator